MQEVLTIIVTYNGMQWIERCIRSVYASIGVDPAVIVVDNASTDGTPELIEKKFPAVKLVKCAENQGFAKANNIGFRYALEYGFDYVYLLNQDAWLFPETMSTLLRAFEGYIDVNGKLLKPGILSPMQMDASLTRMDKQFRKHLAKHLELSHAEVVPVPFVMADHWMVSAAREVSRILHRCRENSRCRARQGRTQETEGLQNEPEMHLEPGSHRRP